MSNSLRAVLSAVCAHRATTYSANLVDFRTSLYLAHAFYTSVMSSRERLSSPFFSILGLSATSWGGLALMAQLERRYVENRKLLSTEAFADLVAIAWAVPGPVACNVAIQLGYVLRGWVGACLAGVASVLPFFLAMTGLAVAYQRHALHLLLSPDLLPRFYIVLTCLIAVTLCRQARSLLKDGTHQVVAALSCVALAISLSGGFRRHPCRVLCIRVGDRATRGIASQSAGAVRM